MEFYYPSELGGFWSGRGDAEGPVTFTVTGGLFSGDALSLDFKSESTFPAKGVTSTGVPKPYFEGETLEIEVTNEPWEEPQHSALDFCLPNCGGGWITTYFAANKLYDG